MYCLLKCQSKEEMESIENRFKGLDGFETQIKDHPNTIGIIYDQDKKKEFYEIMESMGIDSDEIIKRLSDYLGDLY